VQIPRLLSFLLLVACSSFVLPPFVSTREDRYRWHYQSFFLLI
jgi:hypothetical protein